MSPTRSLAAHYLRFVCDRQLAGNSPRELSLFMANLPPEIDRQLVFASLVSLSAGTTAPKVPDELDLPGWFAKYPAALRHADAVLKAGRAPKSYAELIEKAYLTELREVRDRVQGFLQQEIKAFEARQ